MWQPKKLGEEAVNSSYTSTALSLREVRTGTQTDQGPGERSWCSSHRRVLLTGLVKVQSTFRRRTQYFRDARTLEWPPKTAAAVEWSQWEWNALESRRQAVCAADSGAKIAIQAWWRSPEDCKWIPDNWTLGYLYFWSMVLLCSDCDCIQILPSWSKKVLYLFVIIFLGAKQ